MNRALLAQRALVAGVLVAIGAFIVFAYHSVRRDVENLRVISEDNILWTATQMEVELLRFQLSVARLHIEQTEAALQAARERLDILWSRAFMMGSGRVGRLIAHYDEGHDSIPAFQEYLHELDPVFATLEPDDAGQIGVILRELDTFQRDLRLYTLRVVRGDYAAAEAVRDRIESNSRTTVIGSLVAVLLSLLALALLLHDNRRQRQVAELNRRIADDAERSSRAKSRFLSMMSHELRNPLNGLLGPLALLSQTDLAARHLRLVERAQQAGRSMTQMLSALLAYGEIHDGRFLLRVAPFRPVTLSDGVAEDLGASGSGGVRVSLRPGGPEFIHGDVDRLRHVYTNLAEFVLEGSDPGSIDILFFQEGDLLVGDIVFTGEDAAIDWKLDLIMGLNDVAPDQVSSEALRPLIARSLIAAADGVLSLVDGEDGRRAIRVSVPAAPLRYERIRVRLETRSTALSTIYKAALRSDRIVFTEADDPGRVDMVLIDATSIGEEALMHDLRRRFPRSLFVSLGAPQRPGTFDDVVEGPADITRLRSRILARLRT